MSNTTSDNVAEWRRICGDIEAENHNTFNRGMRYCAILALFTFIAAVPLLCMIGAGY